MELILYNGKIKNDSGEFSAVACDTGSIVALGNDESILAMKTEKTNRVCLLHQ